MRYLPYFSTIITFLFMIAVFRRYQQRRGAHLLLWGIGLLFYGLGTLGEVILGLTYHPWVLKLWYLSGAMLTAAWLGTGTLHLLIRKPSIPRGFTWLIGILSLLSLILLAAAPVTDAPYDVQRLASEQYKEILVRNGWIIFLTIFLNIYARSPWSEERSTQPLLFGASVSWSTECWGIFSSPPVPSPRP